MLHATIEWREEAQVGMSFRPSSKDLHEKRAESRSATWTPVRDSDADGSAPLACTIVEASRSGCLIEGDGVGTISDKISVDLEQLDVPVPGRVAWRDGDRIGVKLLWDGIKKRRSKPVYHQTN